ncbi:hypothetical protein GGF32_000233 [Allomyces javanicus]|nr:hypothetical protein GGF32_000233 [Allomyces javanicus]
MDCNSLLSRTAKPDSAAPHDVPLSGAMRLTLDPKSVADLPVLAMLPAPQCFVSLVQTRAEARIVRGDLVILAEPRVTMSVIGHSGVDVVVLAFVPSPDQLRVTVWDLTTGEKDGMINELRLILNKCDMVVHDARADAVLLGAAGLTLAPTVDTRTLFREWHALATKAKCVLAELITLNAPAKFRLDDDRAAKLLAAAQWDHVADPAPSIAAVTCACNLPTNPHAALIEPPAADLGRRIMAELHEFKTERSALAYAHNVASVLLAVDQMVTHVADLRHWLRRATSWIATAEYRRLPGWSVADVPRHTHVHARFDSARKQIVWRPPAATTCVDPTAGDVDAADTVDAATRAEIDTLFALLPTHICDAVTALPDVYTDLNEIIMDLGRPVQLRFFGVHAVDLDVPNVTAADLHAVYDGRTWSSDRRGGIDGMLHRISWIADRENEVVGLTIRVGRACPPGHGVAQMLQDMVEAGESVLILGKPGTGKTHTLRDMTARLSDAGHHVMVVDTSNEVGGPGNVPHASLHGARRMQVKHRDRQFEVLLEAVQNHTPDMVVIDEISDAREVAAARSVATRIRGMVATAHGTLDSIMRNRAMRDLVGGLVTVTVGDNMANRDLAGRKSVTQRAADATFTTVVELLSRTEVRVLRNMNRVVDAILKPGATVWAERRWLPAREDGSGGEWFWMAVEPYRDVDRDGFHI